MSELARPLTMTLAAVVQHVQVLEATGLVATEKVGRVRTCRIDAPALHTARHWVDEHYAMWERRLDLLGDVLAEQSVDTADPRTDPTAAPAPRKETHR